MVNAIMARRGREAGSLSVRVIINGGEKMPIPLIERIRTLSSAWFADEYGLT